MNPTSPRDLAKMNQCLEQGDLLPLNHTSASVFDTNIKVLTASIHTRHRSGAAFPSCALFSFHSYFTALQTNYPGSERQGGKAEKKAEEISERAGKAQIGLLLGENDSGSDGR